MYEILNNLSILHIIVTFLKIIQYPNATYLTAHSRRFNRVMKGGTRGPRNSRFIAQFLQQERSTTDEFIDVSPLKCFIFDRAFSHEFSSICFCNDTRPLSEFSKIFSGESIKVNCHKLSRFVSFIDIFLYIFLFNKRSVMIKLHES